jgi:hypothetical protein
MPLYGSPAVISILVDGRKPGDLPVLSVDQYAYVVNIKKWGQSPFSRPRFPKLRRSNRCHALVCETANGWRAIATIARTRIVSRFP